MSSLQWSDALALDLPLMDDTHREFVDLLGRVEAASDATLLEAWRELIAHTDDHFGREDEWMRNTQFASSNCHSMQHEVVLSVMREGAQHGEGGDLASVRQMASELGNWFPQHAQSMDAALALHLRRVGYDPLTGIVSAPQALPQTEIHGCGGSCSTSEADAVDAVDAASMPRSAKPALVSTW